MKTVLECLRDTAREAPDGLAIFSHAESGWSGVTWKQVWDSVVALSIEFTARGLAAGDRLAIIAPNSLQWEITHFAALAAGAVVVGLDAHDTSERLQIVLRHAGITALVVDNESVLAKLGNTADHAKFVVLLSPTDQRRRDAAHLTWDQIAHQGSENLPTQPDLPKINSPATIIYTSGTTGEPKGILYNHGQLAFACETIIATLPKARPGARFVCWLPLSNLFQRVMNLCAIASGSSIYVVANPLKVLDFVSAIEPDVFIGVPRFYEKLALGIKSKVAEERGLKRIFANYALSVGDRYATLRRAGSVPGIALQLQHKLVDRLVLRRLRGLMGHRLQYLVSGSAPIPKWILEYFASFGWLVLEAYGLSENILPVAMNTPGAYQFGSVGKLMPGSELRIADDGELMVKGPGLFAGYLGVPGSFEAVSEEGFYRTGDIGRLDETGFLKLTGRKSEIIKTTAGRRIALPAVESVLRELPWVDHAVAFGSGRKCLVALLTINGGDQSAADTHTRRAELAAHIDTKLSQHERPAAVMLLSQPFTIDGGELTPNLKLRRMEIEKKYQPLIEELFAKLEQATEPSQAKQFVLEIHE